MGDVHEAKSCRAALAILERALAVKNSISSLTMTTSIHKDTDTDTHNCAHACSCFTQERISHLSRSWI